MNGFVDVLRLQEQELGHNGGADVIGDVAHETYYSLLEQAGKYVVGPFTSAGLLYHHGNQVDVANQTRSAGTFCLQKEVRGIRSRYEKYLKLTELICNKRLTAFFNMILAFVLTQINRIRNVMQNSCF